MPPPSLHRAAWLRWVQLLAGLFTFGVAVSLLIRSNLGLGPWDAFHVGLHNLTGMSIGTASIAAGLAVVLISLFIEVRPGIGTLLNMVLIGVFIDVMLPWTPPASGWLAGLGYYAAGVGLCGLATGMYIAAGFGKGPRDGLMVGIHRKTGWNIRRVRTLLEMAVLAMGWLMGGAIGVGTLLFTFTIGPATQWGMNLFGLETTLPAAPLVEERRAA